MITGLLTFICGCEDRDAPTEEAATLIQALEGQFILAPASAGAQIESEDDCMQGDSKAMWATLYAATGRHTKDASLRY